MSNVTGATGFVTGASRLAALLCLLGAAPATAQGLGVRAGMWLGDDMQGGALGAYYRMELDTHLRFEAAVDLFRATTDDGKVDVTALPLRISAAATAQGKWLQVYALAGAGIVPGLADAGGGAEELFARPEVHVGAGIGVGFDEGFFLALDARHSWASEDLEDRSLDVGGTTVTLTFGMTMDFTQ